MLDNIMFRSLPILALLFLSFSNSSFAKSSPEQLQELLQQHKGNVIYVDFWASWCSPCRKSFPWMNEMQSKYDNLKIISINLDQNKELATEFLTKTPANFSIIYDPKGQLAKQYKVQGMPSSYIFNKDGELVNAHIGFTEAKQKAYESELQEFMKE